MALKTRKEDIVRRRAKEKRSKEHREQQLQLREERKLKRQKGTLLLNGADVLDAEEKFKEDHKEEIEAAQKYEERLATGEEEEEPKEVPVMPVFNKTEFLTKFDEEFPEIIIPTPVVFEKDKDWLLS